MTDRLTARQMECLRLSATMTDKDIGRHLGISHHTVSLHVREAMRRLDAPSRKAALRRLASNPLYASPAIPLPADPASAQVASSVQASHAEETGEARAGWFLPPPPRRAHRLMLVIVFAAFAALTTVGIVNVVSIALGNLAPHAPPAGAAPPN